MNQCTPRRRASSGRLTRLEKKGLRPSFGFHFLDAYNIMLNLFSAGVDPRHLFTWHTNGVRTEQNNDIPSSPPNTHFCWLHDWQTAFAKGWKKPMYYSCFRFPTCDSLSPGQYDIIWFVQKTIHKRTTMKCMYV